QADTVHHPDNPVEDKKRPDSQGEDVQAVLRYNHKISPEHDGKERRERNNVPDKEIEYDGGRGKDHQAAEDNETDTDEDTGGHDDPLRVHQCNKSEENPHHANAGNHPL